MIGPSSLPSILRNSEVAIDTPLYSLYTKAFPDLIEKELTEYLRKVISE